MAQQQLVDDPNDPAVRRRVMTNLAQPMTDPAAPAATTTPTTAAAPFQPQTAQAPTQPTAPAPVPAPAPVAAPAADAGYQTDFGGGNTAQQTQQIQDTYGVAAPEGYDATKWADPTHQSDKYLAGHIQAASGSIDDVVHALSARTPGWTKVSNDTIRAPDGSIFDLRRDSGGANAIQWLQVAGPGGTPMGGGGAGGVGAGAAGSGATDAMHAMLLDRIKSLSGGVDVNDPSITEPFSAANLVAERGQEQLRKDLAERLYATGDLNSASLTQGVQQSRERMAGGLATLKGNLVQAAYKQQRDDLQATYQLAVAQGDAEAARNAQLQIANLDAQVRREGIGAQLATDAANRNQTTVTSAGG